ncbi:MAG TPA: MDR family MFS transporter [Acidimicrobiales bacterium]
MNRPDVTLMTAGQLAEATGPGASRARWAAMTVLIVGTVMVVLDSTIVNVALPRMAEALDAGDGIEWVVSAYLLAFAVAMPITGWLGARFGHKRVYLISLAAFTGASIACALAPTLPILVVARIGQGLGGGVMMPVGMVIGLKMFPREEHGRAMGIWGLAAMGAPAIGPTLGGWLVDTVSWHWLFLINVPLGVAAVIAGMRLIPEVDGERLDPFDAIGFVTGAGGLALLVLGLSEGNRWGWSSTATLGCIGIGLAALVMFVWQENRIDAPMLDLGMFRNATFSLAFGISFFVVASQFTRLVFVPLNLQTVRGYSALEVGLMLLPAALATAISINVGGWWADRVGPRRPVIVGVAVACVAMFLVAAFGLESSLWVLGVLLTFLGVGVGLQTSPATVAAMDTLSSEMLGQGSAMRNLSAQIAGAVAVAGLGALLSALMPVDPTAAESQGAYSAVFYASLAGLVLALVMALYLRPGPPVADDDARRVEMRDAVKAVWE